MSISDRIEKIKLAFWPIVFIEIMLIFSALVLIYQKKLEKTPLEITFKKNPDLGSGSNFSEVVIGSKTGKKYYLPWCGGLSRIKSENRIQFANAFSAREAGYTPAKNCKGL